MKLEQPKEDVDWIRSGESNSHYTMNVGPEDAAAEDVERIADVADRMSWQRLEGGVRQGGSLIDSQQNGTEP